MRELRLVVMELGAPQPNYLTKTLAPHLTQKRRVARIRCFSAFSA